MSVTTSAELAELIGSSPIARLAVLASFDPERLGVGQLGLVCEDLVSRGGRSQWMLRETARVDALAHAIAEGGRDALRRLRAEADEFVEPSALQTMLDAAIDDRVPSVEVLDEDALVAALTVTRWILTACSYARRTDLIPSGLDRDPIEARLARLQTMRPILEITADGCVGRERERAIVAEFVDRPEVDPSLADLPALQIYGIGGVGKSTLVAQVIRDLDERPESNRPLWAYLDLDRPTLSGYEPEVILGDVIRQVSAQLPQARRDLLGIENELARTSLGHGIETDEQVWWYAAEQLARVVGGTGSRLVVVLDTFEELQRGWDRSGDLVFEMFHQLSIQIGWFRLIVAGRAPVEVFLEAGDDVPHLLRVDEFDPAAAGLVLAHLHRVELGRRRQAGRPVDDVPLDPTLLDQVTGLVGGSPLTLRLAALVLADEGMAGITDAAQRARTLSRVRAEFIRGFLYHRILDHLGGSDRPADSPLAAIARASLVLRVITPQLLDAVVFPVIGRTTPDGSSWFEALRREKGLAFTGASGLQVRDELRGPALLALRYDDRDLVHRMHEAAAAHYRQHRAEPGAAEELAYHLLALGREPESLVAEGVVSIDALLAALSSGRTSDLSEDVRTVVTRTDARRDLLTELERRTRERELADRVGRALAAGDVPAANSMLADRSSWSSGTMLHRLDADVQERLGHIAAAAEASRRELRAAEIADGAERFAAAAIRCALLQERNDDGRAGVSTLAEAMAAPLLAGQPALLLHLHLNRMTLLERIEADDDWWLLELDARTLVWRLTVDETSEPAMLRLLAATLGRSEPARILSALDVVGLGAAPDPALVHALVSAMTVWNEGQTEPGQMARRVGLPPLAHGPEGLRMAWAGALSGPDAGPVLRRAFSVEQPPDAVLEALRRIYLWWGVVTDGPTAHPAGAGPASAGSSTDEHFLDGELDFTDAELQVLLRTLARAYPTTTDLQVVASRSGLDVRSLNLRERPQMVWQQVLTEASAQGVLPVLVRTVLSDQSTAFLHDQVADAVGTDWLDAHHIPKSS